jgi:hypothetical protein
MEIENIISAEGWFGAFYSGGMVEYKPLAYFALTLKDREEKKVIGFIPAPSSNNGFFTSCEDHTFFLGYVRKDDKPTVKSIESEASKIRKRELNRPLLQYFRTYGKGSKEDVTTLLKVYPTEMSEITEILLKEGKISQSKYSAILALKKSLSKETQFLRGHSAKVADEAGDEIVKQIIKSKKDADNHTK